MTNTTPARGATALILAILLAVPAWAVAPSAPQLPNPGSAGMSKADQEKLGLQAVAEIYKQMSVLPDSSPITQYVQQLGKRLEKTIPDQYSWPYQFHVVQQREVNAFALPGGPIFINVGAINAAANEAQLAGVMAHEMSHVYMQHSAKQAPKRTLAQILGAIGGIFGGSTLGTLAQAGIQLGAGTVLLRYSRADEAQADSVGAIIMYKIGYNPIELAHFFETLAKQGGNPPQFLSDHPSPGNRSAAINRKTRSWPPEKYLSDSPSFLSAKKQASSVKTYTAQEISDGAKQGLWAKRNIEAGTAPKGTPAPVAASDTSSETITNVTFEQVKPGAEFTEIHQNGLSISYPSNWSTASGKNSLTIAPRAGASENSIAYGVVIGIVEDPNAGPLDPASQNLIQNLAQSNPGMRQSGDLKRIEVNGTQARSADLAGDSPVQQNGKALPERDWLVVVPRSGGTYLYLIFISPERDFGGLRPTYQKMLDSLSME
jgi:beta-barrel assembly-enhancing protease